MQKEKICKKLKVMQRIENGVFGGPIRKEFVAKYNNYDISITIEQSGIRNIILDSNKAMNTSSMGDCYTSVETILMLFDGRFYPIKSAEFLDEDDRIIDSDLFNNRLKCYTSKDYCKNGFLKLVLFSDVLNDDLLAKWKTLIDEMDIVYKVFLYSISDSNMTSDINFAFLIELAEPFVELVKKKTCFCKSLSPSERTTTLKMCIDSLITIYGIDIFKNEMKTNFNEFLDKTVSSRVRIMHIKNDKKDYFNGFECVKYSMKFALLYRKILLCLLGVNNQIYDNNLKIAIDKIDKWEEEKI